MKLSSPMSQGARSHINVNYSQLARAFYEVYNRKKQG